MINFKSRDDKKGNWQNFESECEGESKISETNGNWSFWAIGYGYEQDESKAELLSVLRDLSREVDKAISELEQPK